MKVVVLGASGMLGHAVGQYFTGIPGYKTFLSFRNNVHELDPRSFCFDALNRDNLKTLPDADYVINCIGWIKQRSKGIRTNIQVNTQFPHFLAMECEKRNMRLIHVSTDCVFSGKKGGYNELDVPDCTDLYGVTKQLGEPSNCMVLRTSVIGNNPHGSQQKLGFLEWARSMRGRSVDGYVNHMWNGLTNREFARACRSIIENDLYVQGTRHVFSATVSKLQLLHMIDKKYNMNLNIESHASNPPINRTLSTLYRLNEELNIPPLERMIEEL